MEIMPVSDLSRLLDKAKAETLSEAEARHAERFINQPRYWGDKCACGNPAIYDLGVCQEKAYVQLWNVTK